MANCVLCGQKLGMFDQVRIDFHNTKQSVCSDCANRLDNTVGPAREDLFRQILDSPYLENGEEIRGDIYAGKSCPVCGATLHRRLKDFSIGADGGGGREKAPSGQERGGLEGGAGALHGPAERSRQALSCVPRPLLRLDLRASQSSASGLLGGAR